MTDFEFVNSLGAEAFIALSRYESVVPSGHGQVLFASLQVITDQTHESTEFAHSRQGVVFRFRQYLQEVFYMFSASAPCPCSARFWIGLWAASAPLRTSLMAR